MFDLLLVFTARKRSLGQGNMFTGVCLSTGGLVHCPGWGCMVPGGAWSRGVCVHGPGGVPGGNPPTATAAGGTHPT